MESKLSVSALYQVAEIELKYKSKVKASDRLQIGSSKDAYHILLQLWDHNKIEFIEQFKVLLLNRAQKVLGIYEVSTGGISGTIADPRIIFVAALKANASGIVISHNHPSGSLKPSRQDEELTQKLKHAGQFLEIKLLDHIIITSESYLSFADEGLL
ncbi:JAB domain-containing protein [Segetibacter koreensis]|uniref:JAB domain-containing protein n=1 Tax=Segetibacter koreensis TaxID=398037 RepID=UPI000368DEFE|nr:JAB domain-containing protein [Segetibacter koreensis]